MARAEKDHDAEEPRGSIEGLVTADVLDSLEEGVIIVDAGARARFVNASAARALGWPAEAIAGRVLADLFAPILPDGSPFERDQLPSRVAARTGLPVRGVVLGARRADGSVRWFLENARPLRSASGTVGLVVISFVDVTERLEAEREVRRLASIVEFSTDAIFSVSLDGVVVDWNRGSEVVFGVSASEIMGAPASVVFPGGEAVFAELRARVVAGQPSDPFVTGAVRGGGERVDVALSVSPVFEPDGRITSISVIARDVTSHLRAISLVQRSEAEFRQIVETAQEGIWVVDANGRTTLANGALAAMLGCEAEDMIGAPFLEFVPGGLRDDAPAAFRRVLEGGPKRTSIRLQRHDGTVIDVVASVTPRFDDGPDRPATGSLAMITDISDIKDAERDAAKRALQQAAVARLGRAALSDLPLFALCEEVVAEVADALRVDVVGILLPIADDRAATTESPRFRLVYRAGTCECEPVGEPFPGAQSLAARAFGTGDLVVGAPEDGRCCGCARGRVGADGTPPGEAAAVDIASSDGSFGVLAVCSRAGLGDDDANFLRSVAAIVASAHARHVTDAEIVIAEESERQRISEAIHDDPLQVMSAVALRLELFGRSLDPTEREAVAGLVADVRMASTRLRDLMFDIFPDDLEEYGIGRVLRAVLDHAAAEAGFTWEMVDELDGPPELTTAMVVFRTAQEAIVNIRKHAKAANVTVRLTSEGAGVRVAISDDGVGADADHAVAARPGHRGMTSMRRRVERAGGWWRMRTAQDEGTDVEFFVPHR